MLKSLKFRLHLLLKSEFIELVFVCYGRTEYGLLNCPWRLSPIENMKAAQLDRRGFTPLARWARLRSYEIGV